MSLFSKILTAISAIVAIVGLVFVFSFFLLKLLWAWVIPDLFPEAVKQNLIAKEISWFTSFKLAVLLSFLGGFMKIKVNK